MVILKEQRARHTPLPLGQRQTTCVSFYTVKASQGMARLFVSHHSTTCYLVVFYPIYPINISLKTSDNKTEVYSIKQAEEN